MKRLPEQYMTLLESLLTSDFEEKNERTGANIKLIPPTTIQLDLSDNCLPTIGVRKTNPRTAAVEMTWFLQGEQNLSHLHKYNCHIWDKFTTNGSVTSAYGYRMRRYFTFDQLKMAASRLCFNPTDRQVIVQLWSALDLGVSTESKPCPTHFQLTTLPRNPAGDRYLNMSVYMRSSDVFVGLPYDIMGFAMLMKMFTDQLGTDMGYLTFFLGHPHLYEAHWDMAKEALKSPIYEPSLPFPEYNLDTATLYPDAYIKYWANLQRHMAESFPPFTPLPEVIV